MAFVFPDGWRGEPASGWFSLTHLVHVPCGRRSFLGFDLVLKRTEARQHMADHERHCEEVQE